MCILYVHTFASNNNTYTYPYKCAYYMYECIHSVCTHALTCTVCMHMVIHMYTCMYTETHISIHALFHTYIHTYTYTCSNTYVGTRKYRIAGNFRRFLGWSNIHENKIHELGIIVFSFRMVSQHLGKFYLGIFISGAIRENFVP